MMYLKFDGDNTEPKDHICNITIPTILNPAMDAHAS